MHSEDSTTLIYVGPIVNNDNRAPREAKTRSQNFRQKLSPSFNILINMIKRIRLPARHDLHDHPPTNFGSKGNRTQACALLRCKPCKFVIALNYCTTRVIG